MDQPQAATGRGAKPRLPREHYEAELLRLQAELVKVQEWVRAEGKRVVVVFEGRDAAGKGGTIKRITQYLSPRVARIAALPAPTERERSQWYFQRYVEHLPSAGEIVLFDRSWYNRAGVERVHDFCTPAEHRRFLHQCPIFERLLVEDGILLRKYWFSVSDQEQQRRFRSRLADPMRQWKLSPMDLESITRIGPPPRATSDRHESRPPTCRTTAPPCSPDHSAHRTQGGPILTQGSPILLRGLAWTVATPSSMAAWSTPLTSTS